MLYESAVLRLKQDDCIKHKFYESMRYAIVVCESKLVLHNEKLRNFRKERIAWIQYGK
ncbi:hypothetical protein LFU01_31100 [Lysinibacillus fusiformis]|nr:hypothetical protein LFU01_31100 [Lysinibacillus fusiformis]